MNVQKETALLRLLGGQRRKASFRIWIDRLSAKRAPASTEIVGKSGFEEVEEPFLSLRDGKALGH